MRSLQTVYHARGRGEDGLIPRTQPQVIISGSGQARKLELWAVRLEATDGKGEDGF